MDFFIIPLGIFSAVVGVNWLCTLGPITWDFNDMIMTFKHAGNSIILQGIAESGAFHYSLAFQQESESLTVEDLLE